MLSERRQTRNEAMHGDVEQLSGGHCGGLNQDPWFCVRGWTDALCNSHGPRQFWTGSSQATCFPSICSGGAHLFFWNQECPRAAPLKDFCASSGCWVSTPMPQSTLLVLSSVTLSQTTPWEIKPNPVKWEAVLKVAILPRPTEDARTGTSLSYT